MADKSASGSSEGVNNNNKPAAGGPVDDGGPKPVTDPKLLALSEKTGYPLLQENGQRIYGPPPNWQGAPPPRGCEIFVGKIPRDCMEDELVPIFEKAGRIYEIRLMMDFNGANRGYCFVTFTSRSEAKKAVREINEYEIRSKKYLGVCLSVDNCRLFVGGIPREKKSAEILEEMKKIAEGVVSAIVYPSIADKTKNRGFAFVEFESHRSAAMARRKLMPGRVQMFNQPIAVDWAEPEPEVDEDVMSKVRILYVRNLMLSTQEETLEKAFSEGAGLKSGSGGVERVKKIKDYAFIHFKERGDAVKALAAINGTEIEGSRVEVVFAKPVDKETQSNRHHNQHNKLDMQVPGYPGGYSEYPGALQLPHHYLPGVTFYPQPFLNGGGPHMGVPPVYNNNISSANQMRDSGTAERGSGIRGRSAAGSRAAGGGVKNYQPRNNTNYRPFSSQDGIYDLTPGIELVPASAQNNKSLQRSPAQILEEICQRNGWGSPNYHLHQALSPPGPQGAPTPQLFLYKVHIPGYSQNPFMPNKLCKTMDEARRIASEFTLHKLGQGYQYQGPYSTSGAPGGVNPSGPHPPSMGYHSYPYGSA